MMDFVKESFKVLLLAALCSGLCQDIDTKACESMLKNSPGLCSNNGLALTACPKFCGKCVDLGLDCFHCDTSVLHVTDCNTTKKCQPGERCVLHELMSTVDGHHEYRMDCASLAVCDSVGTLFGRSALQSRDIRTHCCSDDLCNYPITTTLPPPSTTPASCSRDIEIMIQATADSQWRLKVIQFLKDMVSSINIGISDNLVAVTVIDGRTNREIKFQEYTQTLYLRDALDGVNLKGRSGAIHVDEIQHFLNNEIRVDKDHNGNRASFRDSVLIITHGYDSSSLLDHHHPHPEQPMYSASVIVMQVGPGSLGPLTTMATSAQHIINVADYSALSQQLPKVLNLLCQ